jgi:RNA polymerase sigma-70 factor, ECF subfamily
MSTGWLDALTVSPESSLALLQRAQNGDAVAIEALMGRYLTRLQRWAHGRLPAPARGLMDTDDIVQEALMNTFRRLDDFEPRHDGALLVYLRQAVANRIRNELRRTPVVNAAVDLDDLASELPSPFDRTLTSQAIRRYETALAQLDDTDRAAIVGRFEMGYSYDALARALNRPSADAARKVTERALRRLVSLMQPDGA